MTHDTRNGPLHDDDRDDLALLSSGFSSTVVATLA